MIKRLFILLIVSILMHSSVYAGNTAVIRVACIIPVLPGVNAPDKSQQETTQEETRTEDQDLDMQTEEKEEENTRIIVRTMVAK